MTCVCVCVGNLSHVCDNNSTSCCNKNSATSVDKLHRYKLFVIKNLLHVAIKSQTLL